MRFGEFWATTSLSVLWVTVYFRQVLMCNQRYISTEISSKFVFHTQHYHIAKHDASDRVTDEEHMGQIDAGLLLGAFLFDCGWLQDSLKVFKTVLDVINLMDWDYKRIVIKFDCLQRWVVCRGILLCSSNMRFLLQIATRPSRLLLLWWCPENVPASEWDHSNHRMGQNTK